ncbi:unnamed protein product [Protopolystoma xenopodis]|uniref:Uncharacterized protein n=1 Tax=Protopolystoma xenopodis TaxID=117903 RepID=A0A448WW14_9PLAT|nr:unnamed protein product [Protopolystoma xenopodis]
MLTATSGNQNNLVNSASEHGSINRRTEDYHYRHKHRHRRRSNDQLSRIQRQKQDRHSLHLENGHHYPETLIAKPLNKFITGDHISIVPVHRTRGRPVARRPTHENTDISSHRSTSSSLSPVKRAPIDQSPGLTQRPGSLTPLTANAAHLESPHSSTTTTLTPMSTPTTTAATTPCSPPSQPLLGSLSPERRRGRPPGLPSRNGVSDSINPTGPLSILSELADSLEPASNFHRPRREYNVMDQDISRPRHNEPALSNQLYNLLLESSNGTTTCPPDSASTTHVVLAVRGLQTSNSAPVLNSASSLSVANPNSSSPFSSSSSSSSISSSSIYADSHSSFPTASTQNSLTNAVDQKNRSCSKTSTTDSSLDMEINEEDDHQESCSTIDDRTISAVSPHDSSVSLGKDEVESRFIISFCFSFYWQRPHV